MDASDVEAILEAQRVRYGRAYHELDQMLLGMGLDDEQILRVVDAIQPMLDLKEDGALVRFLWQVVVLANHAEDATMLALVETVEEIGRRTG